MIVEELNNNNSKKIISLIRENQKLLNNIGVVPKNISNFIDEIEQMGGAAKICGAGSIRGNNAGAIIVFSDIMPKDICNKYGFQVSCVRGDPLGTRLI